MEAKMFSLSAGGHCSTEQEMYFKTTFQKIIVCRNEEGLGGSEGTRAQIIHYRSGTLTFLSAGSVTTLDSPAKRWANLYTGRLWGLSYVPNVPSLSMPIFPSALELIFLNVLQNVWDISEQNIHLTLPTQNMEPGRQEQGS